MDTKPEAFNPSSAVQAAEDEDVDGVPMADDDGDDVDGEPMVDEDVDGEPMIEDEDLDGEPMRDEDEEAMKEDGEEVADEGLMEVFGVGGGNEERSGLGMGMGMTGFRMGGSARGRGGAVASSGPRKRMRAEDMFADDDED